MAFPCGSRFPLQVLARFHFAAGFSLQSLTHLASWVLSFYIEMFVSRNRSRRDAQLRVSTIAEKTSFFAVFSKEVFQLRKFRQRVCIVLLAQAFELNYISEIRNINFQTFVINDSSCIEVFI